MDHGAAPVATFAADDVDRFAADALLVLVAVAGSQTFSVVAVVYDLTPYANVSLFHWNPPKKQPPSQQQKTTHSKYSDHTPQQPSMSG